MCLVVGGGAKKLFQRLLCSFFALTKFEFQNKIKGDGYNDNQLHILGRTCRPPSKKHGILVTNFKENDGKIAFMMKKTTTIASKGPVIFE